MNEEMTWTIKTKVTWKYKIIVTHNNVGNSKVNIKVTGNTVGKSKVKIKVTHDNLVNIKVTHYDDYQIALFTILWQVLC